MEYMQVSLKQWSHSLGSPNILWFPPMGVPRDSMGYDREGRSPWLMVQKLIQWKWLEESLKCRLDPIKVNQIWLVVDKTPLKNMKVSWDDDCPQDMEK